MGMVSEERREAVLGDFHIGQSVVVHKRARGHWTDVKFGVIADVSDFSYANVLEVDMSGDIFEIDREDLIDLGSWVKWSQWEHRYAD